MSNVSPIKQAKEEPLLSQISTALSEGQAIRKDVGKDGRLHVDRPLPFLCLHLTYGTKNLAARDIASANASYLIASSLSEAAPIIQAIGNEMVKRFGAFVVLDIGELEHDILLADDSPFLPHYEVAVSASTEPETQNARKAFIKAICDAEVRFRTPRITRPEPAQDPILRLREAGISFPCISVRFAPIYRQPESGYRLSRSSRNDDCRSLRCRASRFLSLRDRNEHTEHHHPSGARAKSVRRCGAPCRSLG